MVQTIAILQRLRYLNQVPHRTHGTRGPRESRPLGTRSAPTPGQVFWNIFRGAALHQL